MIIHSFHTPNILRSRIPRLGSPMISWPLEGRCGLNARGAYSHHGSPWSTATQPGVCQCNVFSEAPNLWTNAPHFTFTCWNCLSTKFQNQTQLQHCKHWKLPLQSCLKKLIWCLRPHGGLEKCQLQERVCCVWVRSVNTFQLYMTLSY